MSPSYTSRLIRLIRMTTDSISWAYDQHKPELELAYEQAAVLFELELRIELDELEKRSQNGVNNC